MKRAAALAVALGGALLGGSAPAWAGAGEPGAAPHVLRLATIAPDGTEWARVSRTFAREVAEATHGDVQVKWYFSGIAGDEKAMIDRIRRGQLDGSASGGMLCSQLAPSLRVMRIVGLFESRDEALYVLGRLRPELDGELARSGFANLGETGFGSEIVFSRAPVRTMDDLRRQRFWVWDLDSVWRDELPALGLKIVPRPVEAAGAAYERDGVDGFFATPTAALAYQWTTQARYYTDLHLGYLTGCLVVANGAFDPLSVEDQRAVRDAGAKMMRRLDDMGVGEDAALINGLFEKQGIKKVSASPELRAAFFAAARHRRGDVSSALVPAHLVTLVHQWIAQWRAEHGR